MITGIKPGMEKVAMARFFAHLRSIERLPPIAIARSLASGTDCLGDRSDRFLVKKKRKRTRKAKYRYKTTNYYIYALLKIKIV